MLAYQIVDDLVSIPSKMLVDHPLILEKLETIARECRRTFYPCGGMLQRSSMCVEGGVLDRSYVMMKLIETGHLNVSGDLEAQAGKVLGYCVIVTDGRHTEVYDICEGSVASKKPLMTTKSLLKGINTIKGTKVVLLDANDPDYTTKVSLYAEYNFGKPMLIDETPFTRISNLPPTTISLTNDGSAVNKKQVVSDAYLLSKQEAKLCQVAVRVTPQLASYLLQYTLRDVEYSGTLFLTHQEGTEVPFVSYDTRTEVRGEMAPIYIAPIPDATMSFHSHPAICDTETLLCYVAWPTADDMVAVINGYLSTNNPMYLHLVVTSAGIYFVRLSPIFQRTLLTLSKNDRDRVKDVIHFKFSNTIRIEERKSKGISYDYSSCPATTPFTEPREGDINVFVETPKSFKSQSSLFYDTSVPTIQSVFLNTANSLMFEDLLIQRKSMTDDFQLFKVDFVGIDSITRLNNNTIIKYYGKCPLKIANIPETNIIY